jgi:hypothetical protein
MQGLASPQKPFARTLPKLDSRGQRHHELARLDERLFLEVFAQAPKAQTRRRRTLAMTVDELRRLLIASEIVVLDVVLAALRALERALLLEHPLPHDPGADDDPLIRQRARDRDPYSGFEPWQAAFRR